MFECSFVNYSELITTAVYYILLATDLLVMMLPAIHFVLRYT